MNRRGERTSHDRVEVEGKVHPGVGDESEEDGERRGDVGKGLGLHLDDGCASHRADLASSNRCDLEKIGQDRE